MAARYICALKHSSDIKNKAFQAHITASIMTAVRRSVSALRCPHSQLIYFTIFFRCFSWKIIKHESRHRWNHVKEMLFLNDIAHLMISYWSYIRKNQRITSVLQCRYMLDTPVPTNAWMHKHTHTQIYFTHMFSSTHTDAQWIKYRHTLTVNKLHSCAHAPLECVHTPTG